MTDIQKRNATLGIGGEIVAVRSLGGTDVPFAAAVSLLDDATHPLEWVESTATLRAGIEAVEADVNRIDIGRRRSSSSNFSRNAVMRWRVAVFKEARTPRVSVILALSTEWHGRT